MKHYNIPIFVPHMGCPFDCVFCNQKHITGVVSENTDDEIIEIIENHLATIPEEAECEVAFFGGSFTGIERKEMDRYLNIAYGYVKKGRISGIRISTRPDYINEDILRHLAEFGVKAIELGVQSMDDEVLKLSNRGHGTAIVRSSAAMIKRCGFELGLQMMTGLPGDTPEKSEKTADELIALSPDCVRIYPTLVIKDTQLEKMYIDGEYTPQNLEEAVSLTAKLLKKFYDKKIKVIRVALATTEEISPGGKLVSGPFHSAFRELAESRIYYEEIKKQLHGETEITVAVSPGEISKVIGNKKENIKKFREELGCIVTVKGDARIGKGNFKIRRKGGF